MREMPIKVVKFLEENKNKSKRIVVSDMMEIFNYKKSTALLYYSHRNSKANLDNIKNKPKAKSKRELTFDFFKKNPGAVYNGDNETYADKLDINPITYANYKMQYQEMNPIEIKEVKVDIEEWNKYYKGRIRTKFKIDDSKLFG